MKKIVLILIGILSFSGFGFLNPSDVQGQTSKCQIKAVTPTSGDINTYITLELDLVPGRRYIRQIKLDRRHFSFSPANVKPGDEDFYVKDKSSIAFILRGTRPEDFNAIKQKMEELAEEKKKRGQELKEPGKIELRDIAKIPENPECEIPFTFLLTPPVPPLPPRPGPELVNCPSPFEKYGKTCIETALGLIPTQPAGFTFWIFRWVIGIAGGIAFLLILIAAIVMTIGGSNPEGLKWANETMTNTLIGLVFIIFSVILLRLIGVDILGIPGFGR